MIIRTMRRYVSICVHKQLRVSPAHHDIISSLPFPSSLVLRPPLSPSLHSMIVVVTGLSSHSLCMRLHLGHRRIIGFGRRICREWRGVLSRCSSWQAWPKEEPEVRSRVYTTLFLFVDLSSHTCLTASLPMVLFTPPFVH